MVEILRQPLTSTRKSFIRRRICFVCSFAVSLVYLCILLFIYICAVYLVAVDIPFQVLKMGPKTMAFNTKPLSNDLDDLG